MLLRELLYTLLGTGFTCLATVMGRPWSFFFRKDMSSNTQKSFPGLCRRIIGANGAGKSTFLKILSGQLEPSTGNVYIDPKARMSVLKQDQTMYDPIPCWTR